LGRWLPFLFRFAMALQFTFSLLFSLTSCRNDSYQNDSLPTVIFFLHPSWFCWFRVQMIF
jgi:hypothetical protein